MPWKASNDGSWFKMREEYHAFIWCHHMTPATFKSLVDSKRVSLSNGDSWSVQKVDYMAVICTSGLTRELIETAKSKRQALNRVTLYDLNNACKMGRTVSPVFQEFEKFMRNEFRLEFKPVKERSLRQPLEASLAVV